MKFKESLLAEGALYTDFYQLTMAQVYFQLGIHEKTSQFDYFFRSYPDYGLHQAGYCINAGMEWLLDWMNEANFLSPEIEYLSALKNHEGNSLFSPEFLNWLSGKNVATGLSIQAIPEGRVVHPYVPLAVVSGADPFCAVGRIFAAQSSELPNADRHQSRQDPGKRHGTGHSRIRAAPRPGPGRHSRRPGGDHWRRCRHFQYWRFSHFRIQTKRHTRPQPCSSHCRHGRVGTGCVQGLCRFLS